MRIAWLIQELKRGGGHRVCIEVSKVLAGRGHDVYILVPRGRLLVTVPQPLQVIQCGVPFDHAIKSILFNGPAILRNLPKVDLILSTMPYMGILNTIATWYRPARGVHFVMADDYHLFDDRSLIKSTFLLSLHKLSVLISYRLPIPVVANSEWTRDQVAKHGPRPKYILNPGVDPEIFKPMERETKTTGTYRIATMPRKHRSKGWAELIDALNLLWMERQDFRVVGITQDPIITEPCQFPLEIVSPSNDQELVQLLQSADIFVSSSRMEGIPLPPLEAMATGVPVVATNIGGIREYAVHGVNAWLVSVNLPAAMKVGIGKLLDNPEMRNQLRGEGLKTIQRFTWQSWVDGLEKILAE